MTTSGDDWRAFTTEDGFPVANEDRDGDVFTHPTRTHHGAKGREPQVFVCTFLDGLGWCWYPMW